MKTRFGTMSSILAVLGILVAAMAPQSARAGLDIAFGGTVHVNDDTDVYLAVSTHYFDRDRADVDRWNRECRNPDDLAVALFIARHSGKDPDAIFAMHKDGLSWWEVSLRLGVKPEVWFVPVRRTPDPPYGKAYGYYKKHGHDHPEKMRLTDGDMRDLAAVRLLHDYYGVNVEVAMTWRSSGRGLREITANEYRTRHGKSRNARAERRAEDESRQAVSFSKRASQREPGKAKHW